MFSFDPGFNCIHSHTKKSLQNSKKFVAGHEISIFRLFMIFLGGFKVVRTIDHSLARLSKSPRKLQEFFATVM